VVTAIQSIEGEERVADRSPQSCFVAAEAVEREKDVEAACEVDIMMDDKLNRVRG
jgi:hypothetical protein